MARNVSADSYTKNNEEIFMAGVLYLSKKYKIDTYTCITKGSYHIEGKDEDDLNLKRELVKIFQK